MTSSAVETTDRPVARIWQVLAMIIALFVIYQDIDSLSWRLHHRAGLGADAGLVVKGCDMKGDCRLAAVTPGSWAQANHIRVEDVVRYDRRTDCCRFLRAGESSGLTVTGAGIPARHLTYVATPYVWSAADEAEMGGGMAFYAGCLIMALIGAFVILRSRGSIAALLLGAAFACNGLHGSFTHLWQSTPLLFPWFATLVSMVFAAPPMLFLAFAWQFRRDANDRDGPWIRWLVWGYFVILVIFQGIGLATQIIGVNPSWFSHFDVLRILTYLGLGLSFAVLAMGWHEAAGDNRGRYLLILTAVTLTMGLQLFGLMINAMGNDWRLSNPMLLALVFCSIAGPLLFAYAVLRHRIMDVGFAINQTLIYGAVSFVVLLLFGLAEWGIEKILPHEWHEHIEANAFISAGIALVIFLLFHRIRDFVEHVIEGVFFHKWRRNEAELNRFVKKAAHILKPEALKAAAVTEFTRFSGGAGVALYRAERGQFVRDAGMLAGLDAAVDADMAALVTLRAEGKPLFDTDAAALGSALVLPMIQRNELTGFIALGAKPSGDAWRPDERTLLAEAAQKIGLDLHALRIEELESEARGLRQELAVVSGKYEAVRGTAPA